MHASTSGLARGLTPEEKREGFTRSPEFFVRKNGLVYVAGENSIPETRAQGERGLPNKLPESVDEVKEMIDGRLVGRLKRAAGAVSALLKEENGAVVEKEQVRSPLSFSPSLSFLLLRLFRPHGSRSTSPARAVLLPPHLARPRAHRRPALTLGPDRLRLDGQGSLGHHARAWGRQGRRAAVARTRGGRRRRDVVAEEVRREGQAVARDARVYRSASSC